MSSDLVERSIRRRSSSSSDDSSEWSPHGTPTPIRHIPFNNDKSKLQSGKIIIQKPPSFSIPTNNKKRISSSSLKIYRAGSNSWEDTYVETSENDNENEELEENIISNVEINLESSNPFGGEMSNTGNENEGDEIDMFLYEDIQNIPSSPEVFWNRNGNGKGRDRKGKKRARQDDEDNSIDDGDDEMETEGILSVKQKGKRPIKYLKQALTYPNEKSSALGSNFSVVRNICNKMNGLHASSTVIAMNVNVPTQPSSNDYPQEKHSDLLAYEKATRQAGAGVNFDHAQSQKLRHKRLLRKRGQHKRCFEQLTASDDPLIALPVFRNWNHNTKVKSESSPSTSTMDISDAEEVDQEMQSLTDIESNSTAGGHGHSSDIDMKSVSSLTPTIKSMNSSPKKVRNSTQLDKSHLLDSVEIALKKHGCRRFRPSHAFAERVPGQSTAQLHRTSPSSLLPARKYMTRSHKPINITANHKSRSRRSQVNTVSCLMGQTLISMLRAELSARQSRRSAMLAYNARTSNGIWRMRIGNWWRCDQIRKSTEQWWLSVKGPDEVEVEALLSDSMITQDEVMLSPSSSPKILVQAKKRVVQEVTEELMLGSEVEERWARRNELRSQELAPYLLNLRLQAQAKRAEERRARVEVIRRRLAEIAEQRRLEEAQQREEVRLAEEERRRLEAVRVEQEEQQRLRVIAAHAHAQNQAQAEQQLPPMPGSPVQSESSTVLSDPPEYELPMFPIISARPIPRSRRIMVAPDVLPDYVPDRWNNRSPPPPPPYNARTDCQTLIAPIFIEDEDENSFSDSENEDEGNNEEALISPMILARSRRGISPELRVIGSFPSRQLFQPTPIPARSRLIDPIRSFENAIELEEGIEEETDDVEGHLDSANSNEDTLEDVEEDIVPGSRVAGVFQRVFGLVWGGSRR
ncbi:uncharacterized protein I206_105288 [Kwoniella pini CBS 10737]|uniref:Uncharacterized protein n=1 Tax=Kwoniella pini CBS 10737 TaxID=1296096 RepID=A0A1B9I4P1_9TREE|nr:uncharacterized protein I206_03803 [Kwoniella pini CBS 10737]OCF50479.1 hypothetical protein I206_03803 [Kwoniella pini CBS 10737]